MPFFKKTSSLEVVSEKLKQCDHSGWLHKEGGNNKDFKKRLVTLIGTSVAYYKDEASLQKNSPQGEFVMTAVGHVPMLSKTAASLELDTVPLCFYMDAADTGRRFILFAETYEAKIAWLKAASKALGKPCDVPRPRLEERFAKHLDPTQSENLPSITPAWRKIIDGRKLAEAGDHAAAIVLFEAATQSSEAEGASTACKCYARYEHARLLLKRQMLAEACQLLEAAHAHTEVTRDWTQMHLQLAWCYGLLGEGKTEMAFEQYNAVLEYEPLNASALMDRGRLAIRLFQWEIGLGDLSHVAALGKADAHVFNDIGVCHFELGQQEAAAARFTEALALDDKHSPSYSNRANCLRNLGRFAEADEDYSKAIEIDDANPKAYLARAQLREQQEQRVAALGDYQRVVRLAPSHEFALRKIVNLSANNLLDSASHSGWLEKRGQVNTAYQRRFFVMHGAMVSYYESKEACMSGKPAKGAPIISKVAHVRSTHVAELSPEKASLAFKLESKEGKIFIVHADSPAEKLGWLTRMADAVGGGHTMKRTTVEKAFAAQLEAATKAIGGEGGGGGGSSSNAGGEGGAVDVSDLANADTAWALVARGMAASKGGAPDMARLHLLKAAERSEGPKSGAFVVAHATLGKLLAAKGMHKEASEHHQLAAAGAPENCKQNVLLQLAWSCWHCGRQADAEMTYWAILDADILCWQALIDRARMNLGACRWALALCDLAMVAAMGKADADVCNDLGVSHFESGDMEKALHFFSEAIEKNAQHAPAISNRANCFKHQKKLREAEEDYTRAITIDDTNPKAFMNRGALLRDQGMTTRALRDFERALVLDPTNTVLPTEIATLKEKLGAAGLDARGGGGDPRQRGRESSIAGSLLQKGLWGGGGGGGRTSVAAYGVAALPEEREASEPLRRERL